MTKSARTMAQDQRTLEAQLRMSASSDATAISRTRGTEHDRSKKPRWARSRAWYLTLHRTARLEEADISLLAQSKWWRDIADTVP